jgi:hypothetical protein
MTAILSAVIPLFAIALLALQGPSASDWSRADAATTRLPPSEFPTVGAPLRAELQRRGCTIPQVYTGGPPHNVARGAFRTAGQIDTAVLCSQQHASSILVFWGGNSSNVSVVAPWPDGQFLQVVAPGQIGFSRLVRVASPAFIRKHDQPGRSASPFIAHDGIEDVFVEKASVVWYWHQGQWLQLSGAD